MEKIITYKLGLRLDNEHPELQEWVEENNETYLLLSKITEGGIPYDIKPEKELNHNLFGFPLEHIKEGHLFIIKETIQPGSQEFKITPAYANTYLEIIKNQELQKMISVWKQFGLNQYVIEIIENLTAILRDIQLDKLI